MIVLDTHVWIWWVNGDTRLSPAHAAAIAAERDGDIGVSAIACWEVAKLVALGRLELDRPVGEWLGRALAASGCRVLPLAPNVAVAATTLPGEFHRDPADQIIVATARVWNCTLLTVDHKLLAYPHVRTLPP